MNSRLRTSYIIYLLLLIVAISFFGVIAVMAASSALIEGGVDVVYEPQSSIMISGPTFNGIINEIVEPETEGESPSLVTKVVFDLKENYPEIVNSSEVVVKNIGSDEDGDGSYDNSVCLYISSDTNEYGYETLQMYVLGDSTIEFNSDCTDMFLATGSADMVELEISFNNIDTSNVTNMSGMFDGFYATVEYLDLSMFDTGNVTDMSFMFGGNDTQASMGINKINLSSFDTSKVTNMCGMFCDSVCSELDLSSFDTSSVTDMSGMFENTSCELDVSHFNTSNVTNMTAMFYNCYATKLDVANFDTNKVTSFYNMFSQCINLTTLDVSSFDLSSAEDLDSMFAYNYYLTTIYAAGGWYKMPENCSGNNMFGGCTSLVGENGTSYNDYGVSNASYARIDYSNESVILLLN